MIAQWQPGGAYLNDTIRRMHAAFDFCAAHGIVLRHRFLLWCQGESDGDHHTAPDVYAEQFYRMYETLRLENIEHCFLIGIGEYNGPAADISYDAIRNAQYALVNHRSDLTVVSRSFETMKVRLPGTGTGASRAAAQTSLHKMYTFVYRTFIKFIFFCRGQALFFSKFHQILLTCKKECDIISKIF